MEARIPDQPQIKKIEKPTDVPDTGSLCSNLGLLCDLLWSDPDKDTQGWGENERGVSFTFGPDYVQVFCKKHDLDLVCRAHQVVEEGYEFFAKKQLVTLFSAPNYCGEFNNSAAMMRVEDNLTCSFQVLKPFEKIGSFKNRPRTPLKSPLQHQTAETASISCSK